LSYLLDTNACIAIINGRPPAVRQRLREVLESGERVARKVPDTFCPASVSREKFQTPFAQTPFAEARLRHSN
jgi:hypothetical protein